MIENADALESIGSKTVLLALVAAGLVLVLAWRIKPLRFRQLKWHLVIASAMFWGVLGMALRWSFWDSYYRYFAPETTRWLAPIGAIFYGAIGFLFWWLALRLPGNPALNWCLLGGLESIPEHLLGIYRFKILEIPILQGISAESIIVFDGFEYMVYWGAVLLLAMILQSRVEAWRHWRLRQSFG